MLSASKQRHGVSVLQKPHTILRSLRSLSTSPARPRMSGAADSSNFRRSVAKKSCPCGPKLSRSNRVVSRPSARRFSRSSRSILSRLKAARFSRSSVFPSLSFVRNGSVSLVSVSPNCSRSPSSGARARPVSRSRSESPSLMISTSITSSSLSNKFIFKGRRRLGVNPGLGAAAIGGATACSGGGARGVPVARCFARSSK
ncbi:hypothetical protein CLUG_03099 [Clavispora lusitaniae ATCC 42720]|uniref:Uncharacterized protein n=1 Tax=Clavispora lusitaniae (strain ATCC 42720) TaxID=306902 RepID=C4Y3I6_CLAL4|nr:uncharacterized protein CLUG_03099 [Clavispora lusitaniae ATCC 42720]EEQ38972.1 hypothetical protein CLUG_03099 [Clavispora lusitaniae ATCC 42720]